MAQNQGLTGFSPYSENLPSVHDQNEPCPKNIRNPSTLPNSHLQFPAIDTPCRGRLFFLPVISALLAQADSWLHSEGKAREGRNHTPSVGAADRAGVLSGLDEQGVGKDTRRDYPRCGRSLGGHHYGGVCIWRGTGYFDRISLQLPISSPKQDASQSPIGFNESQV